MLTLFLFFEPFIRLCASFKKSIGGSNELSALSRCHGFRKILWPPRAFLWLEMHLLRRDCWPGDPGKSSLEKIISRYATSLFERTRMMKLSCEQWCHLQEMLANLKCPNCFSAKVKLCEEEGKENALCTECDCRFEFHPELPGRWN